MTEWEIVRPVGQRLGPERYSQQILLLIKNGVIIARSEK